MPNFEMPELASIELERRRTEIISLVRNGVESDAIECKREWELRRDTLDNRESQLRFVKLIQALANSKRSRETYLVIGADNKEKSFYPISNTEDFDPATVHQLLDGLLNPMPMVEVYNNLQTDDGEPFILVVIPSAQSRPICIKRETQAGKVHLRIGEIYIKAGTSTAFADRLQLDEMYRERMDTAAETLARKRFAHFAEEGGFRSAHVSTVGVVPRKDLIFGPRNQLIDVFISLASSHNETGIRMILEMMRDVLVSEWISFHEGIIAGSTAFEGFASYLETTISPCIVSLTELGLLVVKYLLNRSLLRRIIAILEEHFNITTELNKRGLLARIAFEANVPAWTSCMACYAGGRIVAAYAISRERVKYLPAIQRPIVQRYTDSIMRYGSIKVPFQFFPFALMQLPQAIFDDGIIRYVWEAWTTENFSTYFGSADIFSRAALKHEAILEFNSYIELGLSNLPEDAAYKNPDKSARFAYAPDLWRWSSSDTWPALRYLYNHVVGEGDNQAADSFLMYPEWRRLTDQQTQRKVLDKFLAATTRQIAETNTSNGRFYFDDFEPNDMKEPLRRGREMLERKN